MVGNRQLPVGKIPDRGYAGGNDAVRGFLRVFRGYGEYGDLRSGPLDLFFEGIKGMDEDAVDGCANFAGVVVKGRGYIYAVETEFLVAGKRGSEVTGSDEYGFMGGIPSKKTVYGVHEFAGGISLFWASYYAGYGEILADLYGFKFEFLGDNGSRNVFLIIFVRLLNNVEV